LVVDGTPWEPETWDKLGQIYALAWRFFAVLADCLNAAAVGAPLLPGFRIRSGFLPAAFCAFIRARFLAMFRYKPGRFIAKPSAGYGHPCGQQAFSLRLFLLRSFPFLYMGISCLLHLASLFSL